jgi:hypothetical protein
LVYCPAIDSDRCVIDLGDGIISRPGPFTTVISDIPQWLVVAAMIAAFSALLIGLVLVQLRNRR